MQKFYRIAWPGILSCLAFFFRLVSFGQNPNDLRLRDYRPVSIYNIPQTSVHKARYPVTDLHAHDNDKAPDSLVDAWIRQMDESGIEKSVIQSCTTGKNFDSVVNRYARYKSRFEFWCGFDYTGLGKSGWEKHAVAELERCHQKGARGVGELGDKGLGEFYSRPTPGWGLHIDDPRMKPLLEKCAELHMPISIHVAEDRWMYLPGDSTNDGLMNAAKWHVDLTRKGILGHDEMVATLEHAVKENPKTIFIACHFANCCADLAVLGRMLDRYPNLYADIAARFGEVAPIPRFVHDFMEKYGDRLVYGTDLDTENYLPQTDTAGRQTCYGKQMYEATFRILQTADEHFYYDFFGYHWPLYGLSLNDKTLKNIYGDNYKRIMKL